MAALVNSLNGVLTDKMANAFCCSPNSSWSDGLSGRHLDCAQVSSPSLLSWDDDSWTTDDELVGLDGDCVEGNLWWWSWLLFSTDSGFIDCKRFVLEVTNWWSAMIEAVLLLFLSSVALILCDGVISRWSGWALAWWSSNEFKSVDKASANNEFDRVCGLLIGRADSWPIPSGFEERPQIGWSNTVCGECLGLIFKRRKELQLVWDGDDDGSGLDVIGGVSTLGAESGRCVWMDGLWGTSLGETSSDWDGKEWFVLEGKRSNWLRSGPRSWNLPFGSSVSSSSGTRSTIQWIGIVLLPRKELKKIKFIDPTFDVKIA